jgi:hypothetical protein
VFIAALFTVARREKQPKCPSMNEWINKIYMYKGMLCNLKKKGNSDTCYNMDEPREYYTVMV